VFDAIPVPCWCARIGKVIRGDLTCSGSGKKRSGQTPGSVYSPVHAVVKSVPCPAVIRLLRGEELDRVSRELRVTAATLSLWREEFMAGGQANLKTRSRPPRTRKSCG